jgi:hypothetical protein
MESGGWLMNSNRIDELKKSVNVLLFLREDALARGMKDLAIVYGWSAIKLKCEVLNELVKFEHARQ